MTATLQPQRGEVWDVRFDPAIGAEIQKTRPAVVINDNGIGKLPLRMVVPITGWEPSYASAVWMVRLQPSLSNGLTKESAADTFQLKSVAIARFVKRRGSLADSTMDDIASAIALCVDAP